MYRFTFREFSQALLNASFPWDAAFAGQYIGRYGQLPAATASLSNQVR